MVSPWGGFDARPYLAGVEDITAEAAAKLRERAARVRCPNEAADLDEIIYCSNRVAVALASLEVPTEPPGVARTRKLRQAREASRPPRI